MDGRPTVHMFCFHYPPMARSRSRQLMAHALADGGFDVRVITIDNPHGFFNRYATDASLPGDPAGVHVERVHTPNWWATGEVLSQSHVLADANANWASSVKRAWSRIADDRGGLLLGVYPPLADARLAVWAKQQTGWPMVLDFRDEFLDLAAPASGRWRRRLAGLEREMIEAADLISVATPAIQARLQDRYGLADDRFVVVYSGYPDEVVDSGERANGDASLRIVYAGAISQHQRPEVLCDAYRRVVDGHPETRDRITATFHGPENYYVRHVFRRHMGEGIEYGGLVPYGQLSEIMARYDVGFLSLAGDEYAYALPRKLFDYINLGLPIVAALPDGEAKRFIERHDIGKVAMWDDASALAEAIYALASDPEERARLRANTRAIKAEFSTHAQASRLARTMEARLLCA